VAASRVTTGNHPLYPKLEKHLVAFFGAESALLLANGYVTSMAVTQALAGQFSHVLIDERAHSALKDAAQYLNCPVLQFKHRTIDALALTLNRCGRDTRPIVLTDGMFAHDGSVAPLAAYLSLLPRDGLLLVDDAHGAGTLGKTGKGTLELENVSRDRVVQCVTLSKAFGVYGGAVLCRKSLRNRIIARSPVFIGSTPLPLPLAHAAGVALRVLRSDRSIRLRLNENARRVKAALRATRFDPPETPGPVVSIQLSSRARIARLKRALLAADILPPFIHYPGSPAGGHFRFVISSEHTRPQLDDLIRVLVAFDAG
ncbi:MAG TPA: pyridoxal phosphate-dependent aminotransferase family protein, partial [Verrucomicrobiota bacterium]|nr:pyridoxal phosphate-dependent aminotransferase family protein [Verrucomicrobiota bacterium]